MVLRETCNIFNRTLYTTTKHAKRMFNMLFIVITWLYVSLMNQKEKPSFCFSTILERSSLGDLRLS
uniref:Uncharacterized protein n=1 Tax=Brassica campestris TaxID=3711 RepID=A0A3P5YUW7_BRACM|nr:unnamed protein product [Brassica rapa]